MQKPAGTSLLLALGLLASCASWAPGAGARVTIGRAIAPGGRPLVDAKLEVLVCRLRSTNLEIVTTDGDGRFRLEVPVEDADEDVWIGVCGIQENRPESPRLSDAPPQHILHRAPRTGGVVDVGDLVLDGRDFCSRLDDDDAEVLLRTWSAETRTCSGVREFQEAILVDVLRRPREHWIPVLESLWQYTQHESDWDDWVHPRRVGDLEVLTTLRRLQGQPDPLHIERTETQPLVVEAPGNAPLAVQLVNRDVASRSFDLQRGGDYRSGRLERWSIELTDAAGAKVPPASFRSSFGGGMSQMIALAPAAPVPEVLSLLHYVGPLPPGEYRMRVLYHDKEPIAPPASRAWRLVSTSDEIALRVTPRKIALTREQAAGLRKQFDALDPDMPVLLLDAASAGKELRIAAPESPDQHLLAAGWRAVPILLEALEDERTPIGRRAWALALLYDITGLVNPESEWNAIASAGSGTRTSAEPPNPEDQAKLIERWRQLRGLIEVDVDDR